VLAHHFKLEVRNASLLRRKMAPLVLRMFVLLLWVGTCPDAFAEPGPTVRVRCDTFMGAEDQARVEVRVRSELRNRKPSAGTLELACEPTSVTGGWRLQGALVASKTLSVGPEDARPEMLLWLASLMLETANEPSTDDTFITGSTEVAALGPESQPEWLPAELSLSDATSSRRAPAAIERTRATLRSLDLPSPPPPISEQKTYRKTEHRLIFELGIRYAYYSGTVTGTLGPTLHAQVPLARAVSLAMAATLLMGTSDSRAFRLLDGAAFGGLSWAPFHGAEVTFGPTLSWARASETRGEASRDSMTGGLEGSLKVRFAHRKLGLFSQLGVRSLADDRYLVTVGEPGAISEAEVLIPHWHAFFSAGMTIIP
jgi:hypothetical protein